MACMDLAAIKKVYLIEATISNKTFYLTYCQKKNRLIFYRCLSSPTQVFIDQPNPLNVRIMGHENKT